jgi:anti-sigma factor RsiW
MTRGGTRSCDVLIERLSAYVDGDLGAAACDRIQAHARACPRCAVVIAGLRKTAGVCHRAGRAPLPAPVRARARQYIDALLGPTRARRRAPARRSSR